LCYYFYTHYMAAIENIAVFFNLFCRLTMVKYILTHFFTTASNSLVIKILVLQP
jgi:hypothetical protein